MKSAPQKTLRGKTESTEFGGTLNELKFGESNPKKITIRTVVKLIINNRSTHQLGHAVLEGIQMYLKVLINLWL